MTRLARRPTKSQARRFASTLSFLFVAALAVLCLCPVASVRAEENKSEYGTVIGIGASHYVSST